MKNRRMLYIILGFGCGLVLAGVVGLITSLNPQAYTISENSQMQDNKESSASDIKDNNKVEEYKIEQYINENVTEEDQGDEKETLKNQNIGVVKNEVSEVTEDKKATNRHIAANSEEQIVENEDYIYVDIPKDFGATEICQLLEQEKIIENADEFLTYIREEDKQTKLLDGRIEFKYGMKSE